MLTENELLKERLADAKQAFAAAKAAEAAAEEGRRALQAQLAEVLRERDELAAEVRHHCWRRHSRLLHPGRCRGDGWLPQHLPLECPGPGPGWQRARKQ